MRRALNRQKTVGFRPGRWPEFDRGLPRDSTILPRGLAMDCDVRDLYCTSEDLAGRRFWRRIGDGGRARHRRAQAPKLREEVKPEIDRVDPESGSTLQ